MLDAEALREENARLREEVAALKEALGATAVKVPYSFGLTSQQARMLGILFERERASDDALVAALYATERDFPKDAKGNVHVQMTHLRRKVKLFGITVSREWGRGYYVEAGSKKRIQDVLEQELKTGIVHAPEVQAACSTSPRPIVRSKDGLPFGFDPAEAIVWKLLMESEYVRGKLPKSVVATSDGRINHIVARMKPKLEKFGIRIRNETGQGYFVVPEHKERARALLEVRDARRRIYEGAQVHA